LKCWENSVSGLFHFLPFSHLTSSFTV